MKFLVASVLALAIATPAFAQDEAADDAAGFTGPWIAAVGGLDVLTIQENEEADAARGPMFGGAIGYDFAAGDSVVVGVEGEITSSSADFDLEDIVTNGDTLELKSGRDIYAGARVGYRAGGTLLYIKGGYVSAQHKTVYDDGVDHIEETEDKGGFRVGLGAEFGRKGLFGKVEMRYQDVGDFTVFGVPTGYARTNFHLVGGVGYRF